MRLLSIDFDFFFPVVELTKEGIDSGLWQFYDWGHKETEFHIVGPLWTHRASSFITAGLPLPGTSGEEKDFWDRVDIAGADLYVAESHCQIIAPEVIERDALHTVESIVNCDAHHDGGYHKINVKEFLHRGIIHCDDWAVAASASGIRVHTLYPRWRAYAMKREPKPQHWPSLMVPMVREVDPGPEEALGTFDRVFLCRSGAWVPPWLDEAFAEFVDAGAKRAASVTRMKDLKDRTWDITEAHQHAENWKLLMQQHEQRMKEEKQEKEKV